MGSYYKYSYPQWKLGEVLYREIDTNSYLNDCISEECLKQIKKEQREIFDRITDNYIGSHLCVLDLENKDLPTLRNITNNQLETINNLFNGPYKNYGKIEYLNCDVNDWFENFPSVPTTHRFIPPIGINRFDDNDIELMRESLKRYLTSNQWNYEIVETPIMQHIRRFVEYKCEVWTRVYHELHKLFTEIKTVFEDLKLTHEQRVNRLISVIYGPENRLKTLKEMYIEMGSRLKFYRFPDPLLDKTFDRFNFDESYRVEGVKRPLDLIKTSFNSELTPIKDCFFDDENYEAFLINTFQFKDNPTKVAVLDLKINKSLRVFKHLFYKLFYSISQNHFVKKDSFAKSLLLNFTVIREYFKFEDAKKMESQLKNLRKSLKVIPQKGK